ncbi:hypothetical protein IEO21_09481 [Rhodonia placenta]|uniref:Impact N-terminal domain-containing protein n=1 Tax=Rhodonia placenta TaxID=104341 RepID=A0A8H7NU94_9APHY|nr:hypothetical protein IEO21_09481 [Postia placenta]
MSTLDSFISSSTSRLPPECIATSQEIRDRGSTFVATIYPAASLKEARAAVAHVKHIVHRAKPASHEVAAWRCMVLRPGKTGLEGPDDFELQTGCQDDGEQHGGGKVLRVMQDEGILDAAVVVSRWYGGVMLGPVRFAHFETCAREVCRKFRLKDEMAGLIATLSTLDATLDTLRSELAQLTTESTPSESRTPTKASSSQKKPDYSELHESLDISKAKRLVKARENATKVVRNALQKKRGQAA